VEEPAAEETFAATIEPVERPRRDVETAVLQAVRSARQDRFDRVVFEFAGPAVPGYRVAYATGPVYQCGSGDVLTVAGSQTLVIDLSPAQAHTEAGAPTVAPQRWQPGLPVLQDVRLTCDFEGTVSWMLGLTAQAPVRVSELANPTRLVVDLQR
jgi:hypothetical protein